MERRVLGPASKRSSFRRRVRRLGRDGLLGYSEPNGGRARGGAERAGLVWLVRAWLLGACVGSCMGPEQPEAPGGGQEVILDYDTFVAEIEPILQQRGCSNSACHGDQGSGELLLSGGDVPEADFVAVRGHVTPREPARSPLLLKPLAEAAGGVVHGGGDIFSSTDDHDYQTMLDWIVPESMP